MSHPETPAEIITPESHGARITMSLTFAEVDDFCADGSNPAGSLAWGILADGVSEAAKTQPVDARQMIEQLAASAATGSRRIAGFAIGPLAVAFPGEEREPILDLWATLLNDPSDEVKREAGGCLLAMVDDQHLPHDVVTAVFRRVIDAM